MASKSNKTSSDDETVSFAVFFLIWAKLQGWTVPDIHIGICHFMEHRGRLAVLKVFRGVGKSTILAVYNAWAYYRDAKHRILHQGDQDSTAHKTSRDTRHVIAKHPLTMHLAAGIKGDVAFWWVPGHNDQRNPSMQAAGILSNITSSRADEVQNDDVEVLKNVETPEAREKLRHRLSEQIHIAVPGAKKIYIGTPHTHNSLYDEQAEKGAEVLNIPLFAKEQRFEETHKATEYLCDFKPEVIFVGIGKHAKVLEEGKDYRLKGKKVLFPEPPCAVVDCYAGNAWPERFTTEEMAERRRECNTLNYWDSQYQLHAKPVTQVRLDPEKIIPYDVEPMIVHANRSAAMYLGKLRLAGMAIKWDPASGKLKSDVSSLSVVLQDNTGRRYWHRSVQLLGEVAEFADDGKTIIGGQVWEVCNIVEQYSAPRVTVETNGIGGFAPAVLKAALKQRKLQCGVTDHHEPANKNKRILEAFQPLISSNMLWAHVSVLDGPVWDQMQQWNPAVTDQPDDYLDSGAGAITLTPERIQSHQMSGKPTGTTRKNWQPTSGVFDVQTDY